METFKNKVLNTVRKIQKGKVLSYKEVAKMSGRSGAYRAVGNIMSKNYNPDIPCHRVIYSNGKIGKFNRGGDKKEILLRKEGYIK